MEQRNEPWVFVPLFVNPCPRFRRGGGGLEGQYPLPPPDLATVRLRPSQGVDWATGCMDAIKMVIPRILYPNCINPPPIAHHPSLQINKM